MADKELKLFEEKNLAVFKQLSEFKKQQDAMKEQEKKLKDALMKSMEEYGIKSFKNDYVSISYIDESETESLDLKAFKEKEPELYEDLKKDYIKVRHTSAYIKITAK